MRIALKEARNTCGSCTLCCKVMGILEGDFHKPKDQWCEHALKAKGCGIYDTRPSKCRDFECLWLSMGGPSEKRPDKLHGLMTTTTDGKNWVIHEDPGYEGVARRALRPEIDHWLNHGPEHYVIIVCGTKRQFCGDVRTFNRLRDAGADEVQGARDIREPVER